MSARMDSKRVESAASMHHAPADSRRTASSSFHHAQIPGGVDDTVVFTKRNNYMATATVAPAPDPGPESESVDLAKTASASPMPAGHRSNQPAASQGRRRSYWRRRMDNLDDDDDEDVDPTQASRLKYEPGSIGSLPISMQAQFRRKVILIFSLQLLLLTCFIAALTFIPSLDQILQEAFRVPWYLLIAFSVMLTLLGLLYKVQSSFPINWVVLVAFTGALGVLAAGVQVPLDSHAGVFCCLFTFLAIGFMSFMVATTRRVHGEIAFLSSTLAGFLSFAVVTIGSLIVFYGIGWHFVSRAGLWYSILLQFVLLLWFSYDAAEMFKVITPDEYMNGVVYFYIDLVIITVVSIAIGGLIFLCSMFNGTGGGAFGFGSADCYGCTCCARAHPEDEDGEHYHHHHHHGGHDADGGSAPASSPDVLPAASEQMNR